MVLIDCDVHNYWDTADVLLPYLQPMWRDRYIRGEKPGPKKGTFPHAHRPYYHPEGFKRHDINPQSMQEWLQVTSAHCDEFNIDHAILTGDEPPEASTISDPYYAAGLVSAFNDFQLDTWLPYDKRFAASVVICANEPNLAAQEIRRVGGHPRMVQALATEASLMPLGHPYYHPIYEACNEMGIPFAIHLGGHGGIHAHHIVANGPLTYFWEAHANLGQGAMTQITSMISNGVFEKYPDLKMVVIECGVAIFAPILWRIDGDYKALKKETPWLKMLPSEYFRRNVRLTTQPLEQPDNTKLLWAALEAIHAEDTLMFASDFPHWDFDNIDKLNLPPDMKENILGQTALKTYPKLAALQQNIAAE
ncbi:MAG: amidohydrolase family protein [Alphaproteobacteria bacterium]|nr:amidohydrolase family protein [Alphaproteobacteria bacterium]